MKRPSGEMLGKSSSPLCVVIRVKLALRGLIESERGKLRQNRYAEAIRNIAANAPNILERRPLLLWVETIEEDFTSISRAVKSVFRSAADWYRLSQFLSSAFSIILSSLGCTRGLI